MAKLQAVAELEARNLWPNPTALQIAMLVASAKIEYGAAYWLYEKEQIATEGFSHTPSTLLREQELEVKNDEIDISPLRIMNSLSGDRGILNIGGLHSGRNYIKSTFDQEMKYRDDDSIGDDKPYYILGRKIVFPRGAGDKVSKLKVIYVDLSVDAGDIECNDYLASKVREKLHALYGTKFPEDKTVNNSINN